MNKREMTDAAYHYAVRFNVQDNAHRTDRLGTFGPASTARRIDPKTGEVIEILERSEPAPRARKSHQFGFYSAGKIKRA